jgi:hypothetical protein
LFSAVLEETPVGVPDLALPEVGLEQPLAALAYTMSADGGRDLGVVGM